jgi:hypothetical protein
MNQKKSHLRRNIAIVMVVILFLVVGIIAYNSYQSSRSKAFTEISEGEIVIPPLSYKYLRIDVPSDATDIFLSIYFIAKGGSGNDIRCYVMDQINFINWENGHQAYAIYNSGQVTTAKDRVSLPGPGIYYIVFDNTFSAFSSKTVYYSITLSYYKSS